MSLDDEQASLKSLDPWAWCPDASIQRPYRFKHSPSSQDMHDNGLNWEWTRTEILKILLACTNATHNGDLSEGADSQPAGPELLD